MTLNQKLEIMENIEKHNEENIRQWVRMTHGQEYEEEMKEERKNEIQKIIIGCVMFALMVAEVIIG